MKTYLLPLILCFTFACDDESEQQLAITPSNDAGSAADAAAPTPELDQGMMSPDEMDIGADATAADQGVDAGAAPDVSMLEDAGHTMMDSDVLTVGRSPETCETIALLAPSIPSESGHYAAKILTPAQYPFAIESIQYALVSNEDVPTCSGAVAHRVLLFAIEEAGALPATPSATGLGYRQYDVPAEPDALAGRQVNITVPIPLIITEGQRIAVAIQFAVDEGRHPCLASCEDAAEAAGIDWWSNAAESPFAWQDLIADFGLDGELLIRVTGSRVD